VPRLIYSMSVSLDGFITGPDGNFDWSAPDEELHRFHNERVRALGAHVLGRRLYETMKYWETAQEDPAATDYTLEFAEIWKALPKVVFSDTVHEVVGNTRLAQGGIAEEVAEVQARSGKDVAIGGAELAAEAIKLGLVDDFQLFVYPVLVGGGKPFFPSLEQGVHLNLVETRTFE
jgi:dihydrofolate reductase